MCPPKAMKGCWPEGESVSLTKMKAYFTLLLLSGSCLAQFGQQKGPAVTSPLVGTPGQESRPLPAATEQVAPTQSPAAMPNTNLLPNVGPPKATGPSLASAKPPGKLSVQKNISSSAIQRNAASQTAIKKNTEVSFSQKIALNMIYRQIREVLEEDKQLRNNGGEVKLGRSWMSAFPDSPFNAELVRKLAEMERIRRAQLNIKLYLLEEQKKCIMNTSKRIHMKSDLAGREQELRREYKALMSQFVAFFHRIQAQSDKKMKVQMSRALERISGSRSSELSDMQSIMRQSGSSNSSNVYSTKNANRNQVNSLNLANNSRSSRNSIHNSNISRNVGINRSRTDIQNQDVRRENNVNNSSKSVNRSHKSHSTKKHSSSTKHHSNKTSQKSAKISKEEVRINKLEAKIAKQLKQIQKSVKPANNTGCGCGGCGGCGCGGGGGGCCNKGKKSQEEEEDQEEGGGEEEEEEDSAAAEEEAESEAHEAKAEEKEAEKPKPKPKPTKTCKTVIRTCCEEEKEPRDESEDKPEASVQKAAKKSGGAKKMVAKKPVAAAETAAVKTAATKAAARSKQITKKTTGKKTTGKKTTGKKTTGKKTTGKKTTGKKTTGKKTTRKTISRRILRSSKIASSSKSMSSALKSAMSAQSASRMAASSVAVGGALPCATCHRGIV